MNSSSALTASGASYTGRMDAARSRANEVYGDADVGRRAAAAMPNAQLGLLPDAGHLCWLDDLDRAATVVRDHLLA